MSLNPARTTEARDGWLRRNRAAWNDRAAGWDAMLEERPDMRARELEQAIEALDLRAGFRLLDAGCGTGQWAIGFARHGCRVTAIDLAPSMLERARWRSAGAGVDIEFREGDIGALADEDATYDAIHCRCALQFTPDPAGVLREFHRVLRPGGRLFVAVPGALSPIYSNSWRRFLDEDAFNTRMLPWELEALLDELSWTFLDGWGTFSMGDDQADNPFNEERMRPLPLRLQQAAAAWWTTIATPAPSNRDAESDAAAPPN